MTCFRLFILSALTTLLTFTTMHMGALPMWAQSATPCSGTDAWIPADAYFGEGVLGLTTRGDALYALHQLYTEYLPEIPSYQISTWDGTRWDHISRVRLRGLTPPYTYMAWLGSNLYVGGGILKMNDETVADGMVRFDGERWYTIPTIGGHSAFIGALAVADQTLYAAVTVRFEDRALFGVAAWDGDHWRYVDTNTFVSLPAITLHNGSVYAFGVTHINGTDSTSGIAVMRDGRFVLIHDSLNLRFETERNNVVASTPSALYLLAHFGRVPGAYDRIIAVSGDSVRAVTPALATYVGRQLAAHYNELFCFGIRNTDITSTDCGRFDGAWWHPLSEIGTARYAFAHYRNRMYVGGGSLYGCTNGAMNLAVLCDNGACSMVHGTVYNDANGNCLREETERGSSTPLVRIEPGGYVARCNYSGIFMQMLPPGSYTVSLARLDNQSAPCTGVDRPVALASNGAARWDVDFALRPTNTTIELATQISSSTVSTDPLWRVTVVFRNSGTAPAPATTATLRTSRPLIVSESTRPVKRATPEILTIDIPALGPYGQYNATIAFQVPDSVHDRLLTAAAWLPADVDTNPANNRDSTFVNLDAAPHLNAINVEPPGIGPDGLIGREDSVLTYTIRFHNTTADSAFRVVLMDTLDPSLDPSTLTLMASSRPLVLEQWAPNVLTWTFTGIRLTRAFENEYRSGEYLTYRIHLRPGLPNGRRIEHRVGAYYGFAPVVLTNTAVNTIQGSSSVREAVWNDPVVTGSDVLVSPNPATDALTILLHNPGAVAMLENVAGRRVRTTRIEGTTAAIDISDLASGSYMLTVVKQGGGMHRQRIVVKR